MSEKETDDTMTARADAENDLKKSKATRKGKLGACTRKMNEIKNIMTSDDDAGVKAHLELLYKALDEFKNANELVQLHEVDDDERENDKNTWYEPKMDIFKVFLTETKVWLMEKNQKKQAEVGTTVSVTPGQPGFVAHGRNESVVQTPTENVHQGQCEEEAEKLEMDLQATIRPEDSVSVSTSKTSRSSSGSGGSRLSASRIRAEAERASLMARAAALSTRHSLDLKEAELKLEEAKLKSMKEKLDLDTDIAASTAKIRILETFETLSRTSSASRTSGNAFKAHRSISQMDEIVKPTQYEEETSV